MIIILLRGFSTSGKDFVGNILVSKYNYKQYSFAGSLKQIVSDIYNIPLDLLYSQEGKLIICNNDIHKRTHRQLLIDEALRLKETDYNIFAKHCSHSIYIDNYKKIVITDWRFENELDVLKQHFPDANIIPVHIIRINQNKSPIDDISEYHLIDRKNDYTIMNNMDNSLYQYVDDFIKSLLV
jgi:hypothetical protein